MLKQTSHNMKENISKTNSDICLNILLEFDNSFFDFNKINNFNKKELKEINHTLKKARNILLDTQVITKKNNIFIFFDTIKLSISSLYK